MRNLFAGFLFLAVASTVANAQEKQHHVFTHVDAGKVRLTPKQEAILERVKKSPATTKYAVVRVHDKLFDAQYRLVLDLWDKKFEVKDYKLEVNKKYKSIYWEDKKGQWVWFSQSDRTVAGLICCHSKIYTLEPLGGEHAVLVELNQSKFPKD